jgi:multidrug efflux pump subunit AcrB
MNVMSLMGLVMTAGIAVSNSILIVEFTGPAQARQGHQDSIDRILQSAPETNLDDELATILGLIPMALALEPGSEQYAPLARAILGGLTVSVIVTVFLVPAAYLLIHRKEEALPAAGEV